MTFIWLLSFAKVFRHYNCHGASSKLTELYNNNFIEFVYIYQGLSKHQEVGFTPVMKVTTLILVFFDLIGAIKR